MSGYRQGLLTGNLLDYTQRKYKGHRAIPNFVITDLAKNEYACAHCKKNTKLRKFNWQVKAWNLLCFICYLRAPQERAKNFCISSPLSNTNALNNALLYSSQKRESGAWNSTPLLFSSFISRPAAADSFLQIIEGTWWGNWCLLMTVDMNYIIIPD